MNRAPFDIAHFRGGTFTFPQGLRYPFLILLWALLAAPVLAQGRWDFQRVTESGFDNYNPQVAFDRWGHAHMVWGSKDPNQSGVQLFYSSNASGRFSSPVQTTDFGTVVDADSNTSFVFRLDPDGATHLAYVAHVGTYNYLFYTNNRRGEFEHPTMVDSNAQFFDMAIDSTGAPHIVWMEKGGNIFRLHYWNHYGFKRVVWSVDRSVVGYPLYAGHPEIEARSDGLDIAVRIDGIYHIRYIDGDVRSQKLPTPPYDAERLRAGKGDTRLRMTVDAFGTAHIVFPHYDNTVRDRLYYISDTSRGIVPSMLPLGQLDRDITDFDIACNGTDRLAVVWTLPNTLYPNRPPEIGLSEFVLGFNGRWKALPIIADLNSQLASEYDRETWKNGAEIFFSGDRLIIGSTWRIETSDSSRRQTALFMRSGLTPQISYLHPDAAAPGMNVVVETYAPYREKGSFGRDGYRKDTVTLVLQNPQDAARVILGPSVVSWDGRLVSTMVFVNPGAATGPVPITVRVGNRVSNVDTFFIVRPQSIGVGGILDGGGVLGSGRAFGSRSKRGVLVVDSLNLTNGLYTVDTGDIDPTMPGNQGFLPLTILSLGPVRIDSSAVLSVSAISVSGAPGGGGGGSSGWLAGGTGFTGGGGLSHIDGPDDVERLGASVGTGDQKSSRWGGGYSLNGAPGGITYPNAPSGGGTGHPFGASGAYGQVSPREPFLRNPGGFGGGSAGSRLMIDGATAGGGGGGYGTSGGGGNNPNDYRPDARNGGQIVGSRSLVPLAGGSGGGGGGFSANSGRLNVGGGGGGALALISYSSMQIDGEIHANGGDGQSEIYASVSGGGGGSGGGILLGAKGGVGFGAHAKVTARGGMGGASNDDARAGGRGGDGRIRLDGPRGPNVISKFAPAPQYSGPASGTNSSFVARQGTVVQGFGKPKSELLIFTRPEFGAWSDPPRPVRVDSNGMWSVTLGPEAISGKVYLVAMQKLDSSHDEFTFDPEWIMSSAGGNVLGQPAIKVGATGVEFPCIRFSSCVDTTIWIRNPGVATLRISDVGVAGTGIKAFTATPERLDISPNDSLPIRVKFCPQDTGRFDAWLTFQTNAQPDSLALPLAGCAATGKLTSREIEVDLGAICVGECREKKVLLRNTGAAALTIDTVIGSIDGMRVSIVHPKLPLTIAAGASQDVTLRLCLDRIDQQMSVDFRNNSLDSSYSIVVRGVNATPDPALPSSISFVPIDLDQPDHCTDRTFQVDNRSATTPLLLKSVAFSATEFQLLNPAIPAEGILIPPLGHIDLTVDFCAEQPGDYVGQMIFTFGEGECQRTLNLPLDGRATRGHAILTVIKPEGSPRRIVFPPTLAGEMTPAEEIVIKNEGTVAATLDAVAVLPGASTSLSEIIVTSFASGYLLMPNETVSVFVQLEPNDVGARQGMIKLASSEIGWSDSVLLEGAGVKPGLYVDTTLGFGEVCVGESVTRELVIYNFGTAEAMVDDIVLEGADFESDPANPSGPFTIEPISGAMRLVYSYRPTREGKDQATVSVVSGGQTRTILLTGEGIQEHVAINVKKLDFACIPTGSDSTLTFELRNDGACPLVVTDLPIALSGSSGSFTIVDPDFPVTILPGMSQSFDIRFTAGTAQLQGQLSVISSAPEQIAISVSGDVCNRKVVDVKLTMPTMTATVGDYIEVPVLAELSEPLMKDVEYELTITYLYDVLAPLVEPRRDSKRPVIDGTLSSGASMVENHAGTLTVRGTIAALRAADTLVKIPMRVLMGSKARTDISIASVMLKMTGYSATSASGALNVLGCDTGRTIVVDGEYLIKQNVPNPVTSGAVVRYSVAREQHVQINLYDANGTLIRTLVDEVQQPGEHELRIDASTLSSGMYLYEMISGPYREVMQMMVSD